MDELRFTFEAIGIYQAQYSQVDKLWGYFSVVTLAVAGFVIGNDRATQSIKEPVAIIFAYIVFSVGNHIAIVAGQKQLEQLASIARSLAQKVKLDVNAIDPISTDWVRAFHLGVVVVVCLGVFLIARLRVSRRNEA